MKPPKYTHGYIDQHGKPASTCADRVTRKCGCRGCRGRRSSWRRVKPRSRASGSSTTSEPSAPWRGTVNAAIVSYYQCSAFTDGLAESSQKMRRAILERFREEHGDKRMALMHKKALQTILDKKSPAAAANWRKALRGLIDHAIAHDMMSDRPAGRRQAGAGQVGRPSPMGSRGMRAVRGASPLGTRERLAYELLLQVGHSRCDIVRMGRQHVRNGVLSLQRQKTKVAFDVPVMPMLQAAIDAMPPSDHMMFLVTAHGKPFTAAGFGNWFRDVCNAAGLPKRCTSHGVRKAAATRRGGSRRDHDATDGMVRLEDR